ncbi:putative SNARE protein (Ufe1) [Aspergillus affinis]|uniref:putative SNARE protein (Ufe1) n=1 Tax=Aspergillus affinis TaxID=1070780 RepID=UPI0022FECF13|nr:uncharacterized protein KD926_011409 [Aspergillus affinis]KAI9037977.1 hypothetical protein KD926_011409 [Aspergillus affinis]
MTDLTVEFSRLCEAKGSPPIPPNRYLAVDRADEFLKEAHRINSHISSLLKYLHSIRPSYLSITAAPRHTTNTSISPGTSTTTPLTRQPTDPKSKPLSDSDRDNVDSETTLLLHGLSSSISTLSSAESLRRDTQAGVLRKKYGHGGAAARLLWKWAGGDALSSSTGDADGEGEGDTGKTDEQIRDEALEKTTKAVRENVLWFLRRGLEDAVKVQREMVERRIERVREKEKSVLYKAAGGAGAGRSRGLSSAGPSSNRDQNQKLDAGEAAFYDRPCSTMDEAEVKAIEAELSPEQLQLFAEENDSMVKYYEDTLSKVQNAEKSLLEISSLQQTLVSHLSTQEDFISQLATDVTTTQTNIGQGNKELKRATEQRSLAQAVFWGSVGLCTWLVIWDLVF